MSSSLDIKACAINRFCTRRHNTATRRRFEKNALAVEEPAERSGNKARAPSEGKHVHEFAHGQRACCCCSGLSGSPYSRFG